MGYIVTEGDNQGYTVTSEGAAGIIQDGRTAEAAFNNHRDKGGELADPDVPQTGDTAGGLFYALTLMPVSYTHLCFTASWGCPMLWCIGR